MDENNRYSNYTQLLDKVDAMFETVMSRNESQFACQQGCYGCCKSGLSVSHIEASRIREWLENQKDILNKIQDDSRMMVDERFCPLLDRQGLCSIYEVRPMICRSHGMPVSWAPDVEGGAPMAETMEQRDVCPLNFRDVDLKALSPSDVLSLDKLNRLLSLIDRHFDESQAGMRFKLSDIINDVIKSAVGGT